MKNPRFEAEAGYRSKLGFSCGSWWPGGCLSPVFLLSRCVHLRPVYSTNLSIHCDRFIRCSPLASILQTRADGSLITNFLHCKISVLSRINFWISQLNHCWINGTWLTLPIRPLYWKGWTRCNLWLNTMSRVGHWLRLLQLGMLCTRLECWGLRQRSKSGVRVHAAL